MHTSEHHTIFYPNNPQVLASQVAIREEKSERTNALTSLPAAILVPHASYEMILDLLHQGFAPIKELRPRLVVILAPLHQEALEVDKPHFLFTPTGEGITIANTEVRYATDMISTLLSLFGDALKQEDSYFIEEPAVELTLPLIDSYCKGVPVLPLLTNTQDAQECRTYGAILKKIVSLTPETLFVLSANLNASLPSPLATEQASNLVSLLEKGEPLLESVHSKRISSCGIASFEAIRQQNWGKNEWEFTLFSTGGETFDTLTQEYITKERIVWHASAKRKEV